MSNVSYKRDSKFRQWGPIEAVVLAFLAYKLPEWLIQFSAPVILPLLPQDNNLRNFALYGIFEAVALAAVYLIVRLYGMRLRELGLSLLKWRFIALAVVGYCVYLVLTIVISTLASRLISVDFNQAQQTGFVAPSGIEIILVFIALVVMAPFAEELLFRGFLFKGIRRDFSFLITALVVSMLFAVAHGQLNVGLDVFALSLVLCYLREKTDSLWPGVMLHALKNGVAFLLLFIYNVH